MYCFKEENDVRKFEQRNLERKLLWQCHDSDELTSVSDKNKNHYLKKIKLKYGIFYEQTKR